MGNKKRVFVLLIVTVLLLAAGIACVYRKESRPAGGSGTLPGTAGNGMSSNGVQLLSREDFKAKKQGFQTVPFYAAGLLWQGVSPACDEASASIYIPCDFRTPATEQDTDATEKDTGTTEQDTGAADENRGAAEEDTGAAEEDAGDTLGLREILTGLFPADTDGTIYVCEDEMAEDPAGAAAQGHPFEAFLVSGQTAYMFRIVLTGLPAVCMEKTDSEEIVYKEEHGGRIRCIPLSTPASDNNTDSISEFMCRFHVRGNVSSGFPKRPYKISLVDSAGEKQKASFCGLRRDDDWILNPLFTDSTRVREMTAYALWDEISAFSDVPQASARMRYVELFFDNSYQGIYGLTEPVDGKQLGLDEGDLLYKIDRWDREYPYIDLYDENAGKTEIYNDRGFSCVEIRYPKEWDRTASWLPMQAYHRFSFRTQDSGTLRAAGLETDLDSVVSLSLYCALAHAMDNNWKNSFLIAKLNTAGGYTLYRTIWDLNYVFGDVFVYERENGYTAFDPDTASSYMPCEDSTYDFEAFLKEDPSLKDMLRAKWALWRSGGISADSVCTEAEADMRLLTESGAMGREMNRWTPPEDPEGALEKMEDWIRERFAFLDAYFGTTEEYVQ